MFSPKVLWEEPWVERNLITLFVTWEIGEEVWVGEGSLADIMYCSFKMSWAKN